ncbi:phosphate propanoyltransferase [Iocasia frigidifontis]|uniref:phosphate propanoyltransferase n=1 Tax=Iocasia fonsfrigidae TaxID=2682810 RepID=UPI001E4A62EC|nr:phosphate propanoyltransferase [Iocasia fonsfrigidae]
MKRLDKGDKQEIIEQISKKCLSIIYAREKKVPVGISNRHIHLSQGDLARLFGRDYSLTPYRYLIGKQFAAKETVKIIGPKGSFDKVRILGPIRTHSQVEVLLSDSYKLGVKVPLRQSGELEDTPGIEVVGPCNKIQLSQGLICAKRHIHMPSQIARILGVKDKESVNVKTVGNRSLIFEKVLIRVRDDFDYELHIDIDEANAANLQNDNLVEIYK